MDADSIALKSRVKPQNINRNANCICRDVRAVAEIDPTPLLPIVVFDGI